MTNKKILEIGNEYSGFKVLENKYIEEVHSTGHILEHIKSGARLVYLANEDDNKVFSIGFRTPPSDDTGVAHILEHSVLCGSRKYPLKEPFVELVKGSLNTFLNAMTYPDKTVYPVASRNNKDFRNLMDVYLDAVFYPNIYDNQYTLKQEGWHYNIDDPAGELLYNGVVYNEMKGVFSSADALLDFEAMKALFPETPYRFESGGLPEAIPNLTQADFENFHKAYYSPENAYIYLYGDLDILDTLNYLDQEYLSKYTKANVVESEIALQAPFEKTKEVHGYYPVAAGEDLDNKTYHEFHVVTGNVSDFKTTLGIRLLENVLLETESAPLRRALMEAGIAHDISGYFNTSICQPIFSIKASGSELENKDEFIKVIYSTLQKITIDGLDKELLEAALNYMEFKLREADFGAYPKGLIYGLSVMDHWIYDNNPLDALYYNDRIKELREAIGTRYYESLIENYILDNTHRVIVTLEPKPGMEEEHQKAEIEKMAKIKTTMSESDIKHYIADCEELHRLQALPDTAEALESIPLLDRSDIKREITKINLTKDADTGFMYLDQDTNKIAYLEWYFDLSGIDPKLLTYCNLLTEVIGKLNSKNMNYADISKYTNMYTGGISFRLSTYSENDCCDDYKILFNMSGKALVDNLDKLFKILNAISKETLFDDVNRFKELLGELRASWNNTFFARGQAIVTSRLESYFSPKARVFEQDNFTYYQFINDLYDNFDEKGEETLNTLKSLMNILFQKSDFLFAYSCENKFKDTVSKAVEEYNKTLPTSDVAGKPSIKFDVAETNEAITTPGKVQYVAAGGNFKKFNHEFKGSMLVLSTILRYEYLWTKIRVQGGAYGANVRFDRDGIVLFSSYRDPKLAETLNTYKELPEWLKNFKVSDREMTKYVIGTLSGTDVPLTNSMNLQRAVIQQLLNLTDEKRQKTRNEVLDVSVEDIVVLNKVLSDVLNEGYICVVGGKQPIEENSSLFNKIYNT